MPDVYIIRRSDGSYRVVSVPTGPSAPRLTAAIRDYCAGSCDHIIGRVEVEAPPDFIAELQDERDQDLAWKIQHDAEALRDHCRRVVARWRERTTGRGV